MTMIRRYVIRLKHDNGTATIEITGHTSARSALAAVLDIEHAPLRSVQWVRVRPLCGYCGPDGLRDATRYERGGQEDPLCWDHAKEHHGGSVGARECTGDLGVTRLERVPVAEWGERTEVMRHYYGADGTDITGQPLYAEDDAASCTVFTHDGVWLALSKTVRGNWVIESSDFVRLTVSDHERRHGSVDAVVEWSGERTGSALVDVAEWGETDGE